MRSRFNHFVEMLLWLVITILSNLLGRFSIKLHQRLKPYMVEYAKTKPHPMPMNAYKYAWTDALIEVISTIGASTNKASGVLHPEALANSCALVSTYLSASRELAKTDIDSKSWIKIFDVTREVAELINLYNVKELERMAEMEMDKLFGSETETETQE